MANPEILKAYLPGPCSTKSIISMGSSISILQALHFVQRLQKKKPGSGSAAAWNGRG